MNPDEYPTSDELASEDPWQVPSTPLPPLGTPLPTIAHPSSNLPPNASEAGASEASPSEMSTSETDVDGASEADGNDLPLSSDLKTMPPLVMPSNTIIQPTEQPALLLEQEQTLRQEIAELQITKDQLQAELANTQTAIAHMVQEGLKELEQRKRDLQITVEQLERRQERIRAEMRTTFAGASQDLAIRVQSFKEYLVGSLQDLALAAEQLEFPQVIQAPPKNAEIPDPTPKPAPLPKFAEQSFQEQTKKIRSLLDQYRNQPDYYGPPWQLRRTFEPVHAERVSNWFFTQGGRGAIRTMGSRLQNILIASAIISVLGEIYGDRLCALILAESPERLGEWRRGLQDCLGITRSDFGPDRGAALFEDPLVLSQKADRLQKDGLMPLIVMDETEEQIDLTILQFPLWLAFAPNPQSPSYGKDFDSRDSVRDYGNRDYGPKDYSNRDYGRDYDRKDYGKDARRDRDWF
jgi:hypothetical protein